MSLEPVAAQSQNEAPSLSAKAPLTITFRCQECPQVFEHVVHSLYFTPPKLARAKQPNWDGVFIPQVITCPACQSKDRWTIAENSVKTIALQFRELEKRNVRSADDLVVKISSMVLPDGSFAERASSGLEKLKTEAQRSHDQADIWRKLGNYCELIGLDRQESETAWRKAVEVSESEFIAAHALAVSRFNHDEKTALLPLLERVAKYLPGAQINRELRATMLVDLVSISKEIATTISPLHLLIEPAIFSPNGPKYAVNLNTFDQWQALAETLVGIDITSLQYCQTEISPESLPVDHLLDAFAQVQQPSNQSAEPNIRASMSQWKSTSKKSKKRK